MEEELTLEDIHNQTDTEEIFLEFLDEQNQTKEKGDSQDE